MTPLWDKPTAAAAANHSRQRDDGVCRWHAAELWQTRHKI